MWQTVILVFYVNCFSQAGDSCDLYFGAQDNWLSQIAHHLREDKEALICSRASGVLSCALEEAMWDERNPWPIAEGENLKNRCQSPRGQEWCANKQVKVARQVLRLTYLALPASGNLPNLVWMVFGGALRVFRRNRVFIQIRKTFDQGRSVDLLLAHLVHLRGCSEGRTG